MRRLYWVKEGLKVVGFIFGAAVLYSLLMAFMTAEEAPLQDFLQQSTVYFATMSIVMAFLNNMCVHQTIIPISLSFGCTRKESILGIQLFRLTVLLFLLIGASVMIGLMLSDIFILFEAIPIMIGAYLFFAGLGGLLGTFASNVPKIVLGVLSGLAIVFVIILCTIILLATMGLETDVEVYTYFSWFALIIGVATYGICSIFEVRSIRRHYVR